MLRVTVYSDGGLIFWDRAGAVPDDALRLLVVRELENSRSAEQQWVAHFERSSTLGVTALVSAASIAQHKDLPGKAKDILRLFTSVCGNQIIENRRQDLVEDTGLNLVHFSALADVLLGDATEIPQKPQEEGLDMPSGEEDPLDEEADEVSRIKAEKSAEADHTNAKSTTNKEKDKNPSVAKSKSKGKKGDAVKKPKKKKNRLWDDVDSDNDGDEKVLDYSQEAAETGGEAPVHKMSGLNVNSADMGQRSGEDFLVKELEDILATNFSVAPDSGLSFLRGLVGGKSLRDTDLDGPLGTMENHLVSKNVAKEVAEAICTQVRRDLVGTSVPTFSGAKKAVTDSVTRSLRRILTPSVSTDLLHTIEQRPKRGRPYVISVVGVNGVGKSTNLGKLAFWLLQNNLRVLVAACDTFRSGAVEQLNVHVQRLRQLTERQGSGHIELFAQGYGKDAAVIARKAVEYGERSHFDVVLIDTAGRRHNDDRLMSSFEKFGNLAQPDKIVMVGEALVGTDSVEQARNFDAAFGPKRGIDFFLVSKCDTVGNMLGTLVNMTWATGIPVLFVGVGQQYTDLRTLSVDWAVRQLLS